MKDLYEILGTVRHATAAEIKAAYRTRAMTLHPDQGGSVAAFTELQAAYEILIDPDKREHYDRTGTIDGAEADNDQAKALGIVQQLFDGIMGAMLQGQGGDDAYVTNDVVDLMREELAKRICTITDNVVTMERSIKRLNKLAKRFKSKNGRDILRRMVENKIRATEQSLPEAKRQLALHNKALEMLRDESFEFDAPQQQHPYAGLGHLLQNTGLGGMGFR